jgi:hypothetical protein
MKKVTQTHECYFPKAFSDRRSNIKKTIHTLQSFCVSQSLRGLDTGPFGRHSIFAWLRDEGSDEFSKRRVSK